MICCESSIICKMQIINAEDLNRALNINDGINLAIDSDAVTSLVVIVNRPLLKSTMTIVAKRRRISLRLHFDLIRYRPFSADYATRPLTVNGDFELGDSTNKFLSRAAILQEDEGKLELDNQISQFKTYYGMEPSHIDFHHYVHSRELFLEGLQTRVLDNESLCVVLKGLIKTLHLVCNVFRSIIVWCSSKRQSSRRGKVISHLAQVNYGWSEFATHLRFLIMSEITLFLAF